IYSPRKNYQERVRLKEEIKNLRQTDSTMKEIADKLGLSFSYLHLLVCEMITDGDLERKRKSYIRGKNGTSKKKALAFLTGFTEKYPLGGVKLQELADHLSVTRQRAEQIYSELEDGN